VADLHEVLKQLQVGPLERSMPSYTLSHRSTNCHNKSPKVCLCNSLFRFAILLLKTNVQTILCQISQKLSKSLRQPVGRGKQGVPEVLSILEVYGTKGGKGG
jgi:hypothetical protein